MYFDSNPFKDSYLSKSLETERSSTFEKVSKIIFKRDFINKQELELTSIYIQRKLNCIYFQLCINYPPAKSFSKMQTYSSGALSAILRKKKRKHMNL